MYPHDPLCDHVRWLLNNLLLTQAWHKTVLANSPVAYKNFYDSYGNTPYAQVALKLQMQPKQIPLMQATKFLAPQNIAPTFKIGNLGQPKYMPLQGNGGSQINGNLPIVQKSGDNNGIGKLGNGGHIINLPAGNNQPNPQNGTPSQTPGKIVTLPAPTNTTNNNGGIGKIVTLPATNNTTQNGGSNNAGTANGKTNGTPGKIVSMPVNVGKGGTTVETKPVVQTQNNPIRVNNGNTGIVKLNNNPVNKVQVQNNQQNNRPQLNATNRMVNNGGNNFRQSMNQAPAMGSGNNQRGLMH